MKAWVSEKRGTPAQSLRSSNEWPVPKPALGEVLVKIQACTLNPGGYKLMQIVPNLARPYVAEHDFTGIVEDGNGTEFNRGDSVMGFVTPIVQIFRSKQGALAEYTTVPARDIMHRPEGMSIPQAAGLPSAFLTGYQAVVDIAGIESGQTVFINGASCAIGAMAVQIAKARGARVVGCASGRNEALVKSLGVDEFVDYTLAPLHEQLYANPPPVKYHAFIECVGLTDPSLYLRCEKFLAPGGVFITSGPAPKGLSLNELLPFARTLLEAIRPIWLGGVNRSYRVIRADFGSKGVWGALRELYTKGQLKMPIDSEHQFADVLQAYDIVMGGHARGKVVIHIDDDPSLTSHGVS